MADQLQLQIGADTQGLQQGLNRAEKAVKDFDATARRSSAAVGQAGQSLTNLGRIASDLPFGFIAIQNNIDPLIQSFGSLTKTSGGVGGALKALGGALIGPAGLFLAFTTVSTAITIAVQKYGSLGAAIAELTGANDRLARSEAEVLGLQKEANEQTGADIARLTVLSNIAANVNAGMELRARAIDALRKKYGPYLQDVTDEALLNNQAAAAIQNATKQLLAKNLAIAAEKKLAEIGGQLLQNQLDQEAATKALANAQKTNRAENEKALSQLPQGLAAVNTTAVFAQTQLEVATKRATELRQEGERLQKTFDQISKFATNQATAAGPGLLPPIAQPKVGRTVKNNAKEVDAFAEKFKKFQESFRFNAPQQFLQDLQLFDQQLKEFSPEIEIKTKPFQSLDLIKAQLQQEELDAKTLQFNNTIRGLAGTFNDLLSPAINTIFGALENGQNVFKALGQSLKALIVNLVATAAKAAILAAIISLIPGGGAALGVAGSAAGGTGNFLSIFKNFLPGFGGGGPGRSAVPSFAGGNLSPSGFQLAGQVVFVQRGTDLVGVLNQGNARIGRVG
jgi:hypothetical protein